MKKNMRFKNNILPLLIGLFALSLFTACSQENSKEDEIIEPKEEEKDDTIDFDISKVFVELELVKLADGKTFKDNPKREDIVESIRGTGLVFHIDKDGNVSPDKYNPLHKFEVMTLKPESNYVYWLQVSYKDNKLGNLDPYYDNKLNYKSQSFFMNYINEGNKEVWVKDPSKLPYAYIYCDNIKNVKIINPSPVGAKGFINFLKPHTNFDLTIGLFYTGNKTKFNSNGTISPFWGPSPELIKKGKWVVKVKIPIEIEDYDPYMFTK